MVAASDVFQDLFAIALGEGELLVQIRVPKHTDWGGAHCEKFHLVAQSFSIVGVAAAISAQSGTITDIPVALTNTGMVAIRATGVEQALLGQPATAEAIRAAATHAAEGTAPMSDAGADEDYRRHLATVLVGLGVLAAAGS